MRRSLSSQQNVISRPSQCNRLRHRRAMSLQFLPPRRLKRQWVNNGAATFLKFLADVVKLVDTPS